MNNPVFLAITLSGWVLTGSYLLYEYNGYGVGFFSHLFAYDDFVSTAFHFFILTTPLVTTAFGYFYRERTKLLRGIRELETRYRDYYDNAPCGYHSCADDLTFIDVNDSWLRMLGYRRDEVVGKMKLPDLLTPEGRAVIEEVHRFFRESGNVEHLQFDFIRKDGRTLPVVLSATALYDENGGFLRSRTIVKDNAERKNYEAALRAVSEEWQDTFDSMPWGVLLMDDCRSLIRANEYITSLQGISAEELISNRCCVLIDEMEEGHAAQGWLNGTRMQEFHEDHTDRYYRLYGRPITVNGSVKSYVFSLVDVTDIKHGERKLLDSRDAFFNMLKDENAAYKELNELHNNLVLAFANAIDAKSPWTKGHSERVTRYAIALARELGLNEARLSELRTAALLHDIGKIGTYDYLLDKKERLTDEEFEFVKKHPEKSAKILEPISRFEPIIDIIKCHHEQYDGSGYPYGLKGEDIPLMARVLCVADCYDSMTADRPYRRAQGREYAISELKRCSGTQFDPELVKVFIGLLEKGIE